MSWKGGNHPILRDPNFTEKTHLGQLWPQREKWWNMRIPKKPMIQTFYDFPVVQPGGTRNGHWSHWWRRIRQAPADRCDDAYESSVDMGMLYGGFLKWGYPQSSSIFIGCSIINHPYGLPPLMQTPICSEKSSLRTTFVEVCFVLVLRIAEVLWSIFGSRKAIVRYKITSYWTKLSMEIWNLLMMESGQLPVPTVHPRF